MKEQIKEKLLSLFRNFNQEQGIDNLATQLVHDLVTAFDLADAGTLYLFFKDKQQLNASASFGYTEERDSANLTLGEGIPGRCLAERKTFLLTSAKAIERESIDTLRTKNINLYKKMRRGLPPAQGVIAVPLIISKSPIGVIVLEQFNNGQHKFKKADVEDLEILGVLIALVIEYIRLIKDLKDSKRSYRELFGKFLASNEAERKRVSRTIHDEINHILLSVKMNLEDMETSLPTGMTGVKKKLKTLHSHVGKAFDELHRLSFDLRPPGLDELGLHQALDWYINVLSKESGLAIKLNIQGLEYRKAAPVVETALLRITQEALSNFIKHAKASSARVNLSYTEQNIILEVEDDGIGFDVNSVLSVYATTKNLGILGMKERAEMCGGELIVKSYPEAGTIVKTTIPMGSYDWGKY